MTPQQGEGRIILGGGCFWCTEAVFKSVRGVVAAQPGYAGGTTDRPTYEMVSSGRTGHAEVVEIVYDLEQISLEQLLEIFFASHDSSTLNRQGNDVGSQYRSIILTTTTKQGEQVRRVIAARRERGEAIVTEVKPLDQFYPAEAEHVDYYSQHPEQAYCQLVIKPKLAGLKHKLSATEGALLKDGEI